VIHLYAVAATPAPEVGVAGVEGAEVTSTDAGSGLHAIVSELPRAAAASKENALRHAEVVAALGEVVDLLPVRFGIAFADRDQLQRSLAEDAAGLRDRLVAVGGRVEFVVRPTERLDVPRRSGSPASRPASGRAYLEQRLADQRAATDAATAAARSLAEATRELGELAERVVDRVGPAGPERCFLVGRRQVDTFVREAARCRDQRSDLLVGGPWPPYTFASDGSER
jgi:hypothetical protein